MIDTCFAAIKYKIRHLKQLNADASDDGHPESTARPYYGPNPGNVNRLEIPRLSASPVRLRFQNQNTKHNVTVLAEPRPIGRAGWTVESKNFRQKGRLLKKSGAHR